MIEYNHQMRRANSSINKKPCYGDEDTTQTALGFQSTSRVRTTKIEKFFKKGIDIAT